MRFIIERSNVIEPGNLIYVGEDYSFNITPIRHKIEIELILNKLALGVSSGRIVDVSGFCGFKEWMKSDLKISEYHKGILRVEHSLKHGLAYRINNEEFPVHVDAKTGWVCLGDPGSAGQGVEFIKNCVAFIGSDGVFNSLWLKPEKLPPL